MGTRQSISIDRIHLFGKVCVESQSCDVATFEGLSGSYIEIDEDFITGINAVPSSLRITAALPANVDLRIEMIAYYTLGE